MEMTENNNQNDIVLWGRMNSINVQTALWTARELDITVDQRDVGGVFKGLDSEEYGALNPNRQIPTLQDGTTIIWESNSIIRYLTAKYDREEMNLWPTDPGLRAQADMWMDWKKTCLMDPMRVIFWGLVRTPPSERDEAAIRRSAEDAIELYKIFNEWLNGRDYVLGNKFSMGDIPIGAMTYRFMNLVDTRPSLPALEAWYDRLCARPCYKSTVMIPIT